MFLIKNYEWKTDSQGFQYRLDANGTLIVPRALEVREGRVFKRKTAPLGIEELVPTQVNLSFGDKSKTFEYVDQVGLGKIATGSNKDIPFADSNLREETDKIVAVQNGYRYSQMEWDALMEAAKLQSFGRNTNISTVRQESALLGLQTKAHLLGCFGSAPHDINGFYNYPSVPSGDASLNPLDAATTAQDLLGFYIEELIGTIEDAVELTQQPNVIVQSKRLTRALMTKQVENGSGEGNGVTAFDLIVSNLAKAGTPVTIISRNESRSDVLERYGVQPGGTNKDRIVVYMRDPECLSRDISRVRLHDWQSHLSEYNRLMDMMLRGVRWHFPNSAQYVDHPNA